MVLLRRRPREIYSHVKPNVETRALLRLHPQDTYQGTNLSVPSPLTCTEFSKNRMLTISR
jgi:hypothetical protein